MAPLENGKTVARIVPAEPAGAADGGAGDDESVARGVFAPGFPGKLLPGFTMPSQPVQLERRPLGWRADAGTDALPAGGPAVRLHS